MSKSKAGSYGAAFIFAAIFSSTAGYRARGSTLRAPALKVIHLTSRTVSSLFKTGCVKNYNRKNAGLLLRELGTHVFIRPKQGIG